MNRPMYACIQSGLLAMILCAPLASAPLPCNRIRFLPIAGAEAAVLGGKFLGSINGHDRGYVPLGEIKAAPVAGEWGEITFENRVVYRWYRYDAPAGSYGKIAEIEFYDGPTLLNPGTAARSWGSFGVNEGRMPAMAFDHNPKSAFWNEAAADGQFIVLDLLGAATAAIPLFTPDLNQQDGPLDLRIKSSPGALIRYTLDGSIPDREHGLAYTAPIPLRALSTISATAYFPDGGPSPVNTATCLVPESSKPGFSTLHFGNSLTATCSLLERYCRSAGYRHEKRIFGAGGGADHQYWNFIEKAMALQSNAAAPAGGYELQADQAKFKKSDEQALANQWLSVWSQLKACDHVTVQPRDFDLDREVRADVKLFDLVCSKFPEVQPWLYVEWDERARARPSDRGEVPSYQMAKPFPALTWEESMAAMVLYNEELQHRIAEQYRGAKRPRVLPSALMMGWLKNLIDLGKFPGLKPGSFYTALFQDQVHPLANAILMPHGNGGFPIVMTWYSAFYRESAEGKVVPLQTTFDREQAVFVQRLAWDIIKNYPDCGLYEEGKMPVARPEFAKAPATLAAKPALVLTSATPGAWFRYTLDGTEPTRTRGYIYCGLISLQPGIRVKALAFKSGMADSDVAEWDAK